MNKHELKITAFSSLKLLQGKSLKVTKIRVAILDFLISKKKAPYTAQEIYQTLQKNKALKSVDLASVYRNLDKFVKSGIASHCQLSDATLRFELTKTEHHHHIICTSCQQIDHLFTCPLTVSFSDTIAKNYKNLSHKLELYGVCPNCQNK